jgi:hypothetical protein
MTTSLLQHDADVVLTHPLTNALEVGMGSQQVNELVAVVAKADHVLDRGVVGVLVNMVDTDPGFLSGPSAENAGISVPLDDQDTGLSVTRPDVSETLPFSPFSVGEGLSSPPFRGCSTPNGRVAMGSAINRRRSFNRVVALSADSSPLAFLPLLLAPLSTLGAAVDTVRLSGVDRSPASETEPFSPLDGGIDGVLMETEDASGLPPISGLHEDLKDLSLIGSHPAWHGCNLAASTCTRRK